MTSAIRPADQTIAALRAYGGQLPSKCHSKRDLAATAGDWGEKVILKTERLYDGSLRIQVAFLSEVPALDCIPSYFGVSCYNLKSVVGVLAQSLFLRLVEERYREDVNKALRKLNQKIQRYNQQGYLRPYVASLRLPLFTELTPADCIQPKRRALVENSELLAMTPTLRVPSLNIFDEDIDS